jgi:hypothetical protein
MRCDWCNGPRSTKRWRTADGWADNCETCSRLSLKRPSPARKKRQKPSNGCRQIWFSFMSLNESGPEAVNEQPSRKEK